MMRISVGYPSEEEEERMILSQQGGHPLDELCPVLAPAAVLAMRDAVRGVFVTPDVRRYITRLVRSTRDHEQIELGVSPRGSLALYRASQAYATVRGRSFVTPDDVKYLAPSVLAHRIMPGADARLRGKSSEDLISDVSGRVPVPVEAV
jgi:MoxR-like ATPase